MCKNYIETENFGYSPSVIPSGPYVKEDALDFFFRNAFYCEKPVPLGSHVCNCFKTDALRIISQTLPVSMKYFEDLALVCAYLIECRSIYIMDDCLYHYRQHSQSTMHHTYRNYLVDLNTFYWYVYDRLRGHSFEFNLKLQLQKVVNFFMVYRVGTVMGFEHQNMFPLYIYPYGSQFKGKNIILYGAGSVGKNFCNQILDGKLAEIVLWVDKSYENYAALRLHVSSVKEILNKKYDFIIIAVKDDTAAVSIKSELRAMNISEEAMVWKQPLQLLEVLGMSGKNIRHG